MRLQTRDGQVNLGNFGVEIEALIPVRPGESQDHARARLAGTLRAEGLDAYAEGYNHVTRSHWKVVYDASVRPNFAWNGSWISAELVSPILNGEDGFEQIRKACAALEIAGARVNKTCGLHVHHDARHLSEAKLSRIISLYNRGESQTDKVVAPSRRGSTNWFCKSNKATVEQDRYAKVNLTSYYRHGSMEFRQHGGTIDPEKIENWVIYTFLIFSVGKFKTWSEKDFTWASWKRRLGITPGRTEGLVCEKVKALNDWLEARRAHFANA